jgi:hypothetical protein
MEHHQLTWLTALELQRSMRRTAEREYVPRGPKPTRVSAARISLRIDRVWDHARLHELAALAGRSLPDCSFVVGEVDGRIVAALPLDDSGPLVDPAAPTKQLLPLLELRAHQIRRVTIDRPRRRRLWLRRA